MAQVLAVCRLDADAPAPAWAAGEVVSITRTPAELSVVCAADRVPAGVPAEAGWRALAIRGPLAFDLIGVLNSVLGPLAAAAVPVFTVSTYDTDYVLVPEARLTTAIAALRAAGHGVGDAPSE